MVGDQSLGRRSESWSEFRASFTHKKGLGKKKRGGRKMRRENHRARERGERERERALILIIRLKEKEGERGREREREREREIDR